MRRAQLAARGNAPSAAATMRAARCPCRHAPGLSGQVQAKVRVGPVDDPLEREADRAADAVLAGATAPHLGSLQAALQRKCATCEQEEQQTLRRQADMEEEDEELQMKAEAGGAAPAGGHAAAAALGSAGQPLPSALRGYFEPRFGHDFSAVRLHTGVAAAAGADAINARAFTFGHDIVFAAGAYAPERRHGRQLLAHELAHVVQQTEGAPQRIRRQVGGAAPARDHRFTAHGVSVVVRRSCAPAEFGFVNVETATVAALDAIFDSDCIEQSRRERIQRNLTRHGIDIRCRRSANLETPGACAESTGFFIPANIFTLGSLSFPSHPDSNPACQPLESTILHEIVHLTRGFAGEPLPSSCEASCFGVGGADPTLCRDIDVFGRRTAAP